ncbi:Zn-dependent hydrolase [Comamonas serinivorans]|uniref:Zn-dependent hydrolase n=1 Tax=Comamonas serinivorans TaxID=1082851 RepID=A0A1Y0EU80_9BURK|nr:MBL fold metallo-hydrolase [Comamonas serinivorans]ARU06979.1 Zn-dependent hydrolase [Comamonas serinivorans]
MNASELERALTYPLGDQLPALGQALTVAPGIKWLRIGLPFALDHINLWLVRDEWDGQPGWAIVDTCVAQPHAREQWQQIFERELEGLPVVRVIVTHMHPDHIGNARWLCERWNAPLFVSATDYLTAKLFSGDRGSEQGGAMAAEFLRQHGLLDEAALEGIRGRTSYYPSLVDGVPLEYIRMQDGDRIQLGQTEWRCISGYGHAPEHIALHCEALNVLISGDMVLPRISTNVSVHATEPRANALQQFLDSLRKYEPLAADTYVLPSHGKPFMGLHERLRQLHQHHRDRLADLLAACQAKPMSAHDALPVLFHRPLDLHQTTFAMGESVAHLHKLWADGAVTRTQDENGVYRFAAVA